MAAAKGGRKRSTSGSRTKVENEIGDILGQVVRMQVKVVRHMGEFAADAAKMSLTGVVSPTKWIDRYAEMWTKLTADIAKKS